MSTRFIRKRYRRVIPVKRARLRESHLMRGEPIRYRRHYPLYESASTVYNYQNLIECLNNWNEYSGDTTDNIKNVAHILEMMGSFNDVTLQEINEATRVICDNILPYIKNPAKYTKFFDRLNEEKLTEVKEKILDTLYILTECDRILDNQKVLNEKFDVIKYFNESLKIMPLSEVLYRFCDKIEEFNLEYPASFCVAMESALYALDHLVTDEVDKRIVVEGVIDYYLINGGNENLNAFAESLDEVMQKDEFLPNEINDYMLYIQNVLNKDTIMKESVDEYFDTNFDMQFIDDYNNLMRDNAYDVVQEIQLFDKAKEIITKFKALPNKSITNAKEAIRSLLVTSRLQDLKKNTKNALSIAFYVVMLGIVAIGAGAGLALLTFIAIVLIHITSAMDKSYLKNAIVAWREHRYSVQKRLNSASGEERTKLTSYLEEVDKNISILEDEYEKRRDKTASELAQGTDAKVHSLDYSASSNLTNPIGENPLDNHPSTKGVKEEGLGFYEAVQEFALLEFGSLSADKLVETFKKKIGSNLDNTTVDSIRDILADTLLFIMVGFILVVISLGILWGPYIIGVFVFLTLKLIKLFKVCSNSNKPKFRKNVMEALAIHEKEIHKRRKTANEKEKKFLDDYLEKFKEFRQNLTNEMNSLRGE